MGDEEIGELLCLLQIEQQIHDLRLDRHVERADRLIAHDEPRAHRERPRDAHPLPLPAGELVRIAASHIRAQPHPVQQLRYAITPLLGGARQAVDKERLRDRGPHRHARVERRIRVLEDHLHLSSQRAQEPLRHPRDIRPVKRDRAGARLEQAQQGPPQRGLAAARFTHQAQGLSGEDLQVHLLHRPHRGHLARERSPQRPLLARPRHLGGEVLADSGQLHERPALGVAQGRRRHGAASGAACSGKWQRTEVAPSVTSAGSSR